MIGLALFGACTTVQEPVQATFTYAGDHKAPGHVVYLDVSIHNDGVRDAYVLVPSMIEEAPLPEPTARSVGDGRPTCERAVADISGGFTNWLVWRVPGGATATDRCDFRISGDPATVQFLVANSLSVAGQAVEQWASRREELIPGTDVLLLGESRHATAVLVLPPE